MTIDQLERPSSSEALCDTEWRALGLEQSAHRYSDLTDDITSVAPSEKIHFGQHLLVFSEPLPAWSADLLQRISELGELKENWNSYEARPIDPYCAVKTIIFLLSMLDADTPMPIIVPTNRGGIQLEWHRSGVDLEIEIESISRLHVFFADEESGEESEVTLTSNLQPVVPLLDRLIAR